jgi:hypothetical protein
MTKRFWTRLDPDWFLAVDDLFREGGVDKHYVRCDETGGPYENPVAESRSSSTASQTFTFRVLGESRE